MNNSVYGKTIENILKRQNIKYCTERNKVLKYVKILTFECETVFSKNFMALHMNKEKVIFNKADSSWI
jgi:hypothetical protein